MAVYGKLENFDNVDGNWEIYAEKLEQYFEANEINDVKKQKAIFLTSCGEPIYEIIRNLCQPKKLNDETITIEIILEKIKNHLQPTPSFIVQRCNFNKAYKGENENVASFANRLTKINRTL
jgi:hypothetical protein